MAARNNRLHTDEVRERIQASQLINRLQDNAMGNIEPELSQGKLKSIEILLRKSVPDLQAVQITGKDGGPIKVEEKLDEAEIARRLAVILLRAT